MGRFPMFRKEDPRITVFVAAAISFLLSVVTLRLITEQLKLPLADRIENTAQAPALKPLIFYNRPPKTGSTSIRIAIKRALDLRGQVSARCFNKIEWNDMAWRTIVNRRNVDFFGCHTRLIRERFRHVAALRGGNVIFVTSTRTHSDLVLSAYLQYRAVDPKKVVDPNDIQGHVEEYKKYISSYPVGALYHYHGASEVLETCPVNWKHRDAMRNIAARYEVVIDLTRPVESASLFEIVTGIRPVFDLRYNERTTDANSPLLRELRKIDTSHKSCGNELVHDTLKQQFNIIKDRLLQNRCFDEMTGSYELCERAKLAGGEVIERTRKESFQERQRLERIK